MSFTVSWKSETNGHDAVVVITFPAGTYTMFDSGIWNNGKKTIKYKKTGNGTTPKAQENAHTPASQVVREGTGNDAMVTVELYESNGTTLTHRKKTGAIEVNQDTGGDESAAVLTPTVNIKWRSTANGAAAIADVSFVGAKFQNIHEGEWVNGRKTVLYMEGGPLTKEAINSDPSNGVVQSGSGNDAIIEAVIYNKRGQEMHRKSTGKIEVNHDTGGSQ